VSTPLQFLLGTNRWTQIYGSGVGCLQLGNRCPPELIREACCFYVQVVEEVWESLFGHRKRNYSCHRGCAQI